MPLLEGQIRLARTMDLVGILVARALVTQVLLRGSYCLRSQQHAGT